MTIKFKTNQSPMLQEAYRNGSISCPKFSIGDVVSINSVPHKVISIDGYEYGLEVCVTNQSHVTEVKRVKRKYTRKCKGL